MKETIKYGFILGLICFLASGILAVVNGITEPQIKTQREKEENLALKELMPQVSSFKARNGDNEEIIYYRAVDAKNKLSGFILKCKGRGYSSDIEVLAGLDLNLKITNIKILSQNETPGLGSRVSEPSFIERFKGKGKDSLNQVDAITGATISSRAVINSIANKLSELSDKLKEEIKNAG